MEQKYNLKSPAVKRLMREAFEMKDATEEYFAQPLEDNLFEWHFTVRGPPETDFDGGVYHGRIILPPEYPMKPPTIILLTMNGRFEINQKICLSISGHHPETWQPSWSIRTVLLAIIGFMPTPGNGAIGSLDYTPQERWALAKRSREWQCPQCGPVAHLLGKPGGQPSTVNQEAKKLASQISFKGESSKSNNKTDFQTQSYTSASDKSQEPNSNHASNSTVPSRHLETGEHHEDPSAAEAVDTTTPSATRRRTTNTNSPRPIATVASVRSQGSAMPLFLGIALCLAVAVLMVRRFLSS